MALFSWNSVLEDNIGVVNGSADDTLTSGNGIIWVHAPPVHDITGSGQWAASGTNNLRRTFATAGPSSSTSSSRRKFTVSTWVKPAATSSSRQVIFCAIAPSGPASGWYLRVHTDGVIYIHYDGTTTGTTKTIGAVITSTSTWYHVVVVVDTAQGTAADRTKVYINGSQQTMENGNDGGTNERPERNTVTDWGVAGTIGIIGDRSTNDLPWRGRIANIALLDNQALAPTDFGEVISGIWSPKDLSSLSFSNNSFWVEGGTAMVAGTDRANSRNFTKTGTITSNSDSPP